MLALFVFQSHNGAIAAETDGKVFTDRDKRFNPTMVRLLLNKNRMQAI